MDARAVIGVMSLGLWYIFWKYIWPIVPFKQKAYAKKDKLLRLDYEVLFQQTHYIEIISLCFIIAGFALLNQNQELAILSFFIGGIALLGSVALSGRAERRVYWLKKII